MSVSISPYPRFKAFYPGTGNPLAGGQLYTLQPGTSGLGYMKATYTDSTGLTANTNPVILDTNGEADVWLSGYTKLVLYDALGNLVWSRDNVSSAAATAPGTSQWVLQSLVFTYVNGTEFTTPGNQTGIFQVGSRVQAVVAAGTIYGTISASSSGGSPLVTTVTVIWDSGALDSGLSAISTGIITEPPNTLPVMPVFPIGGNYAIQLTDLNKTFTVNSSTGVTLTIPAAGGCPSGSTLRIYNIGGLPASGASSSPSGAITLTLASGNWGGQSAIGSSIVMGSQVTLQTDGTNWYANPLSPFITLTASYTFSGPDLYQTFLLNPSANMTLTLPAASAVPGGWIKLRNTYTGMTYTVQFSGTVDGVSNPYMLGLDWTLESDGTSWHATVGQVRAVPINPDAIESSGAQSSWTSFSMAAVIPAAARKVWGLISVNSGTGGASLSPTSNGYGAVTVAPVITAPFLLTLFTPQTLWYTVGTGTNASFAICGYEL